VGLLAPRQTPNLEDQGIPFCFFWVMTLDLSGIVHFIITLFKVGNVLLCVIYQSDFTVFMYVTWISRYITFYIYSVRYYRRLHETAAGLGTYHPRIRGSTCIYCNCCSSRRSLQMSAGSSSGVADYTSQLTDVSTQLFASDGTRVKLISQKCNKDSTRFFAPIFTTVTSSQERDV
jgi:hypothetical protein